MVRSGQAADIFSLRMTATRKKFLHFPSVPVSVSRNVFFYRKGSPRRYRYNGRLHDLRIGITRGYQYGNNFMRSNFFTRDEAVSDLLGFRKLAGHRIDLFFCDHAVGLYMLKRMGLRQRIGRLPGTLSRFNMYFAFRRDPRLRALSRRFSAVLRAMQADGTVRRIRQNYY